MAKRTPSLQATATDLHKVPALDSIAVNASDAQPLPPVAKSNAKNKEKSKVKPQTLRDDEPLASEQDIIVTADAEPSFTESAQDVVLAQANTSRSVQSAPSSVGEELLRQAGPVPTKTAATQEAGFFSTAWGWPVALGGGALALVAASGGGSSSNGSANDNSKPPADPVDTSGDKQPATPTTYTLALAPMAGKFTGGGVQIAVYKNGGLFATLKSTEQSDTLKWGSGQFTWTVPRQDLKVDDVLHLVLTDTNGSASNYKDEASDKSVDLGDVVLHACTVVPGSITESGTLNLAVTPLTELAHRHLGAPSSDSQPSDTDVRAANSSVAQAFGLQNVDLVQTVPVATNDVAFKNADVNAKAYGQALALISSLTVQLNNSLTGAPTPQALKEALDLLASPSSDASASGFALSTDALKKLSDAAIAYNKAAGSDSRFTVTGITLNEVLGLDKAVSLVDYDLDGLQLQVFAPANKKVGDTITLIIQSYKADGSLETDPAKHFTYQHILAKDPADKNYLGETVTLPRLMANPGNVLEQAPYKDANGKTLQDIGIQNTADGLYHYKVSIEGVSSLGAFQDFSLNLNHVSIQNLNEETPAGYVKLEDIVRITLVLDQAVQWIPELGDAPTLDIQYIGQDGLTHTKTAAIATEKETVGRNLVFDVRFSAADEFQANGLISVGSEALKGVLADVVGFAIPDVKALVNTTLANSHLFADTTLPPTVALTLLSEGHTENIDPTSETVVTATFVNTLTPELSITFTNNDGTPLVASWSAAEGKPVTIYLFAYIDDPEYPLNRDESTVAIATHVVKVGDTNIKITRADYVDSWTKTALDGNGQAYKFFAKVADAAGNENGLSDIYDLPLWIDTKAPEVETFSFDEVISASDEDQDIGDSITNDITPSFVVTGEMGSLVKLYTLSTNASGVTTKTLVETQATLIPGAYGTDKAEATIIPSIPLAAGDYRFATTLTDKAGNEGPLSDSVDVTIKTAFNSKDVTLAIVNTPAPNDGVVYYKKGESITIEVTFAEDVYLPSEPPRPTISFKNKEDGITLTANYVSGSGSKTLKFSYQVSVDDLATADSGTGSIQFDNNSVGIFAADRLLDVAGNLLGSGLVKTFTTTPAIKIDTVNPIAPVLDLASAVVGMVSIGEATSGLVNVTAEEGSKVLVTFTVEGKDVTKTIQSTTGAAQLVDALTEADLDTLGIKSNPEAILTVNATAIDKAGNVSALGSLVQPITIDTQTPTVSSALVLGDAPVIGYETLTDIASVDFSVTFTEALMQAPTDANFAAVSSTNSATVVGKVNSVTHVDGNTYTVNVTPYEKQEGTLVLQLLADATSAHPLKDAAGNIVRNALLNTGDGLSAQQAIDTLPPSVTNVVDDVTATVTNDTIVFTVTFSESVQETYPGSGLENSFSATHATVLLVEPVDGHPNQYIVTVTPDPDVASADVVLSLMPDAAGGFSDMNGNALRFVDAQGQPVSTLSLEAVGGKQAIDMLAPVAPLVQAVAASGAVVSADEAKNGAVNVIAEAGSRVEVTFTAGSKTRKKIIEAAQGNGAADPVKLDQADLDALGIASTANAQISVKATAIDAAGNASTVSATTTLTIDTLAPTVSSVTDDITGTAGAPDISFTVTFSEALVGTVTPSHFTATNANVKSVTAKNGSSTEYIVVVTPALGLASGNIALTLKGIVGADSATQLRDAAGNPVAVTTDLSAKNSQAISTVAPKVTTVTENISLDYANSTSTVVYTVTFDKALNTSLITDSAALKAGFIDANGEVQSVTRVSDTVYKVSVKPLLDQVDAVMSLSIVEGKLFDALGNKVAPVSLHDKASQKIDTSAPTFADVLLATDANTGTTTDTITSVTKPKFELSGLEAGATVTLYADTDASGSYNAGDTLLYQGAATGTQMTVTSNATLADGSYSVRVSQTDVHGNVGNSGELANQLVIQASPPAALTNLVFDEFEDRSTVGSDTILGMSNRNYVTDRPTPTFHFEGGTDGGTAVLFLDKDKDGVLDDGEELGRAEILGTGDHTVQVDALNGLSAGTYGGNSPLGDISILEINAAGVTGISSKLLLSGFYNSDGSSFEPFNSSALGLTIRPAAPRDITISSDASSGLTNINTLSFSITGGQTGGTVTVIAMANGAEVVIGTVASPNGNGQVEIDVSPLATTADIKYTNFKAYQTYAGVKSITTADVVFSDSTVYTNGITFDHSVPTASITALSKSSLLKGETTSVTIVFSEKVTNFTASGLEGLGGGSVTAPISSDEGLTWTTTYTPALNSTAPVFLGVKAGAAFDIAGNQNSASAAVAFTIDTTTQEAPVNTLPTNAVSGAVVGTEQTITGVSVADANNDLIEVKLSVLQGTLSITPTAGIIISGNGTAATPLTLTLNGLSGSAATTAFNNALAKLAYIATTPGSDTLTIDSKDKGTGDAAPRVTTSTLDITNISAAAAAPTNLMPSSVDQATIAIVAGKAFALAGSNAVKVSDVNHDITKVELKVASGTLAITEAITGVTVTGTGTASNPLTLSLSDLSGTEATDALNNALAKLAYTAQGTSAINDTLTVITTDSRNTTDTDTLALAVKAAPNKPVNTVPSAGPSDIIVGTAKALSGISVDDVDNNLASVKLSVLHGKLNMLSATDGVTLSGADSNELTLSTTLTGAAAKTALNSALAKLTYTPTAQGDDTLTVITADSTGAPLGGPQTGINTLALTALAAPDTPVNTLPTAFGGIITGQSAALSGVSVTDGDNNLASVQVSVAHGTLQVTASGSVTLGATNGTSSLTLTGTNIDELNTTLATLRYTSTTGYAGPDTLTVTTRDSTSAAIGGPLSDSDTLNFTVYATPATPVNSVPTLLNSDVLAGQAFAFTGANAISVSDADNNIDTIVLTVDHGTLSVTASSGVTLGATNGTSSITLTGTNTAALNATLATLSYNAGAHTGAVRLTITTTDSTTVEDGPRSDIDPVSFNVLAAPANSLSAPVGAVGGTAINITDLTVTDADNNLTSVVLTVSDGQVITTATDGVVSSDDGKTLTFTGDLAAINTALTTLSYMGDQRGKTGVTLTMVSTDSDGLSNTDLVTFDVSQAANMPHVGDVTITSSTDNYGVGATLTAASTMVDGNGLGSLSYEWFRTVGSDAPTKIASTSNYTLVGADAGATLSVKVSYTDGAGHNEVQTSAPTGLVTWPTSLLLGTNVLSFFHDDPAISGTKNSATSSASNTQLIELQQGKYYVLDVNGDGAITTADKTTYLSGLSSANSSTTTASGVTLQLLSDTQWGALKTNLGSVLPTSWAAQTEAATADYWTSTQDRTSDFHKVYAFGSGALTTYANDATRSSSTPYHYNVFQVI